eukprot:gnl/TRDRNA2_/TRDRNA2_164561_c2_seq2.p1 gnl/TRDRNA2_/TRDRNA2_164561_c2~~gnl/TRDRNA2_/TRDRNA2_164561_c2_seq2.p1  ORF type:complete len:162 (+),score=10.86 gnl/TRDRNA2_/TRDRNA2_164561_c2_seq2:75-488(+)
MAANSPSSAWPSDAKAQAMLAIDCVFNSLLCSSALLANAANSSSSSSPSVANAQAVLERNCGLNVPTRGLALARDLYNTASDQLDVAYAHAIVANSCGWKTAAYHSEAEAMAANSRESCRPVVASAHAVVARSCELN